MIVERLHGAKSGFQTPSNLNFYESAKVAIICVLLRQRAPERTVASAQGAVHGAGGRGRCLDNVFVDSTGCQLIDGTDIPKSIRGELVLVLNSE